MEKRVMVTGGAGFIGSNLLLHLHNKYPDSHFLNVDKLSYASDLSYLEPIRKSDHYTFEKLDIVDRDAVRDVIRNYQPEGIFHLAAESHVDNSIEGPEPFIQSNVLGTFNLLEESRQFWQQSSDKFTQNRFLHVSTDEVYGSLGDEGAFTEKTAYAPNSPYSASKAGSDFIVRSYFHTYGMNVVTTNCSNNFGPNQHDEKLIPTVIRTALNHNSIPVYGKGENVRDWLFVEDHCAALDLVFQKGQAGETYNVGGDNEWKNINLVKKICNILNEEVDDAPSSDFKSLITFVTDRPGHDFRYAIDASKIKRELDWQREESFEERLRETIRWYIKRYRTS